ncbi:MAG: RNA polymerase-associated protein RapA [Pseudomonadales bacterium]|nr:RNA polymerase-associated protein RapA [Pseudomonadales bacterium]
MNLPHPPATQITPLLTPRGHVLAVADPGAAPLEADIAEAFANVFSVSDGTGGNGLLYLGTALPGRALPPAWAWWRDFAARFVAAACAGGGAAPSPPDALELATRIADAPPMAGAEYLDADVLTTLWQALGKALAAELADGRELDDFLRSRNKAWHVVGRVHFNLAENRKDPAAPFAFLATYVSQLSAHGKAQHLPLSQALAEFAGAQRKVQLLSLLQPVQRAAESCEWLPPMIAAGEIYHPLRWQPAQAWRFLLDVPKLEAAGIVVRAPGNWQAGRPARPKVAATVGAQAPSRVGLDALLDFEVSVTLDGERLSKADVEALLAGQDGLQLLRGRWVEVDRRQLGRLLDRFAAIEQEAKKNGLPFAEAMRLAAGARLDDALDMDDDAWSDISAGPWLAGVLQGLRQPEGLAEVDPGSDLKASLRPYQLAGVRWLYLLTRLGLGACLADDMGLGKTIQVLGLQLVLRREAAGSAGRPTLLVAPASLLANWASEVARFAPSLRVLIVHPSALTAEEMRGLDDRRLAGADFVITSYGTLLRQPALTSFRWRLAVIDEAQAIKNPAARQTRQVKQLQADARVALTGTPVENRLSDLWSIFDFTHPGLLGNAKQFGAFGKRLAETGHFGPLKKLVGPYILRRLKTDKRIIADLPDKTEIKAWCHLSPAQASLYQRAVKDLAQALETTEGIERRGIVLAYLMRLKQICNHPSQWLGDGAWRSDDSGKFSRLRELAETIAARQEKLLVFTQFRETTEPLAAFLGSLFGRGGLILHGATPVKQRRERVQRFQEDELTPFFVLSLKAGGAGLNLTAASHVIHFDRWWNPAVENQATDRAFRIGQKKNVLVHKFVCRGTVEDRIDQMIADKQQLLSDVLEGGGEINLTELSDRELLDLVKLDIHAVAES